MAFLTLSSSSLQSALIDLEDLIALVDSESSLSALEYCLLSSFEKLNELTLIDPQPTPSRWLTKARLLLALLRSSQETLTRLCLDIDLTPHAEKGFHPKAWKEISKTQEDILSQITRCILHSGKL